MKFYECIQKFFEHKFENNQSYDINKRRDFLNKFLHLGIPTTKHEEWKYTNLTFLDDLDFNFVHDNQKFLSNNLLAELEYHDFSEFYFVPIVNGFYLDSQATLNGFFDVQRINDESVFSSNGSLLNFERFFNGNNPFSFLNLAAFSDSVFLQIKDNTVLERPIVLQYNYIFETSSLSNTLNFIEVGENSKVSIIILFKSNNASKVFANEYINLHLKQNSSIEISFLQYDLSNLILLNNLNVVCDIGVFFKSNYFSFETQFVRNNVNLAFEGINSTAKLNGVYIVSSNNFVDNHTMLYHNQPFCTSDEDYRGIINEQARSVFNGKIYVARGAQKTNAYQSNKNILLSNEARVYTRPQLEIYADDVKCTHGATAGFLDQDSLFYLTTRGIGKEKAKALLLSSFVSNNLERVEQSELRNILKELVAKKLNLENIYFCSAINELSKV